MAWLALSDKTIEKLNEIRAGLILDDVVEEEDVCSYSLLINFIFERVVADTVIEGVI